MTQESSFALAILKRAALSVRQTIEATWLSSTGSTFTKCDVASGIASLHEGIGNAAARIHAENRGAGPLGWALPGRLDAKSQRNIFHECIGPGKGGRPRASRRERRATWSGITRMQDPKTPASDRADKMLVALGYFASRASAQAAIAAGLVIVDGKALLRPADKLSSSAHIVCEAAHPYVSRGGVKLAHALDTFHIDPAGLICLDLGASTGGFTDVLLRRGAAHVTCVDVGHGQLHDSIRSNPRVTSHERLNARDLNPGHLPGPPQLIVCDLSFVSLAKVLSVPLGLAAPGGVVVALFKPQFEVGPENVGKGGLVTDLSAADVAATRLEAWMAEHGWPIVAWKPSPVAGGDGNAERLFKAEGTPGPAAS